MDRIVPRPSWTLSHRAGVTAFAFRADGKALASGDLSGAVTLWSLEYGTAMRRVEVPVGSVERRI